MINWCRLGKAIAMVILAVASFGIVVGILYLIPHLLGGMGEIAVAVIVIASTVWLVSFLYQALGD